MREKPIILSYSFRTFSFYRPENKLKINFLVVHYILKRKAQYWAFRSAPLGDTRVPLYTARVRGFFDTLAVRHSPLPWGKADGLCACEN